MPSKKDLFSLLIDDLLIMILRIVYEQSNNTELQQIEHTVANARGDFSLVNQTIKMYPEKIRLFEQMDTQPWIRSLITMGIFNDISIHRLNWEQRIKEYNAKIIREKKYTSRVHDLIDISKSKYMPSSMRNASRCLLYNLIDSGMSENERRFLMGEKVNITICTNNSIQNVITSLIDSGDFESLRYLDIRKVTTIERLFKDVSLSFDKKIDVTYWDTKNIKKMSSLFFNTNINLYGITNWNTCNVTDMSYMFCSAKQFNTPLDWNTSRVTNMDSMFSDASLFNQPLSFDTSQVTTISCMFKDSISFNQSLIWNTSQVEDMSYLFENAISFNQPIDFITESVRDMSYMFCRAILFDKPLRFTTTNNVESMIYMFRDANVFNQKLDFDTSSVTDMDSMFSQASMFNQPLESFDTSRVINMSRMFEEAISFNQPLNWNTMNLESMNSMFYGATSFNQELRWNISRVEFEYNDNPFEGSHGRFFQEE
jgi:surface protein